MEAKPEKFVYGMMAIACGLTTLLLLISIPLSAFGIIAAEHIFWSLVPIGLGLISILILLGCYCIRIGFKILTGKDKD